MALFRVFDSKYKPLEPVHDTHITPNFTYEQVLPPEVKWQDLSVGVQANLHQAAILAESVRAEVGLPCTANTYEYGGAHQYRGYRTERNQAHLRKLGYTTATKSRHLLGKAIDLECNGISLLDFAEVARKYFNTVLVYPENGFIHCDTDLRGGEKYYYIM